MADALGQTFPRIPLYLKLPDELPEIGQLMGYSVEARLADVQWIQGEMEIEGSYLIEIRYVGIMEEEKLQEAPLSKSSVTGENKCFCTRVWEEDIHTFVELRKSKHRKASWSLKVDKCDLRVNDDRRSLQGYLILSLMRSNK